ncbi:hypothetical protein [Geomonas ferrireducens]|uniref:hypothetical protein n=1 Tax=Geomonas ferrireducens TaxID=2570227 RepID=UPI0010A7737B|nr:hypothetical protein [Geomonas ferrireducens]
MKTIKGQITASLFESVLSSSVDKGATRFALWFYPSTTKNQRRRVIERFRSYALGHEELEPVTLYFGTDDAPEGTPVEAMPLTFRLNAESIKKLTLHLKRLIRTCDAVATYADNDSSFRCAIVLHEKTVHLRG